MAKHRAPEPHNPFDHRLGYVALIALVIALSGTLAVVLTEDRTAEPAPPPQPVVTQVVPSPQAQPSVGVDPSRSPEQTWHDCQRATQGSPYPGTDASSCMVDHAMSKFMACLVGDPIQCPKIKEDRWSQ